MAVIGFSAIVRDLERIVEGEVEDYEELIKDFMANAYESLVESSPVLSGYYASNHSLSVRRGGSLKTGGVTLEPATKDSQEAGIYEANINPRMEAEISKLEVYKVGDTIRIATAVPYAGAVEALHGVYSGAAQTFDLSVSSSFDEGE